MASRKTSARDLLLAAATERFRRTGYVATTVEEICRDAGVTKGAFFHHFTSKEALGRACLEAWDRSTGALEEQAPFRRVRDPVERAVGYMDFFIGLFEDARLVKSCLAGTTVQEVCRTHPELRRAAHACFRNAAGRFRALLDAACEERGIRLDTASLASLWMATVQGALILGKASGGGEEIGPCLRHVRDYIRTLLGERPERAREKSEPRNDPK